MLKAIQWEKVFNTPDGILIYLQFSMSPVHALYPSLLDVARKV